MEHLKRVKSHFEEEAEVFDEVILKLIPYYKEMIDALVKSIPFSQNDKISVLDLGCGTGTVARCIKAAFPSATITCMDMAVNMIEMAKLKLKNHHDTNYHVADFYSFEFDKKYDVIVSSLALHHLSNDNDKRDFYKKIFNALSGDGVFLNADVVLASSNHLQQLYMDKWKEYMSRSVSPEEIENKWMVTYREEDMPAMLRSHLKWLEEIGFKDVDVVWKYYNFSVYGGRK